jgi:alpha-D-ribose 1-methylphosphonate 5-triphosphate diphosphatase
MEKSICLYGGPVFDGKRLLARGTVVFGGNGIIQIIEGSKPWAGKKCINVHGQLIAPGLVDLHSDALEKCIEMRPGVYFDAEFALQNLDQRIAGCGITTFCHAVSFSEGHVGLRSAQEAENLVRTIRRFCESGNASAKHLVHARLEVGSRDVAARLEKLVEEGLVDLVSLLDHTPGQGQFQTLDAYIRYYVGTYGTDEADITAMARRKREKSKEAWEDVARLTRKVREKNLPLLSHDDDTERKVDHTSGLRVTGSEFPVSLEAARRAKHDGMSVFMGAPNLVRGGSSNDHLAAAETIEAKLCDGLVSDYYPECLIQGPFIAARQLELCLEETLPLVTSGPGGYLNTMCKKGRLIPEGEADLIVIDTSTSWAKVTQAWVDGCCVFRSRFWREGSVGSPCRSWKQAENW